MDNGFYTDETVGFAFWQDTIFMLIEIQGKGKPLLAE
jgi:hypothetical protein